MTIHISSVPYIVKLKKTNWPNSKRTNQKLSFKNGQNLMDTDVVNLWNLKQPKRCSAGRI